MKKRILAFGCHPDDVEFMCAGTLALLARKGFEIHIGVMTGGEVGSTTLSNQKIREQRRHEAEKAAAVIGARCHHAGGCDLEVEYNNDYRKRATKVVRDANPDIVFGPPPMDYLIDHEETSRLVRNAAFIASVPHYDCGVPTVPTKKIPYLYYWNSTGLKDIFGRDLPLTCAVDITSSIETKFKMLKAHASQRLWLKFINGFDQYTQVMRDMSAAEGKRAGFKTAEGFIQHVGTGYPTDNILKKILGQKCIEFSKKV